MGMSYLTSLNPQLFKNIAYVVGSFQHFSVQFFSSSMYVFCNQVYRYQQCNWILVSPCSGRAAVVFASLRTLSLLESDITFHFLKKLKLLSTHTFNFKKRSPTRPCRRTNWKTKCGVDQAPSDQKNIIAIK